MSQLSLSVKLLGVSILDYDGGVEVYIENDDAPSAADPNNRIHAVPLQDTPLAIAMSDTDDGVSVRFRVDCVQIDEEDVIIREFASGIKPEMRTLGVADVWLVKTWLLDDAFGTVDTWVPLVDMFGANAGVMHCQFSSGRPGRPATSSLTSVSLTVEKATLLVTPSDVLGMGASDALIQPRVKVRLHPGRMAYTTLLAKAGSGVNPEWRECFVLPPPTSPESSPCVSFRIVQDWLSATADLVGMAVIVLPACLLSTRGSNGLSMRVPLTHGGGSLFIKLTGSAVPLTGALHDVIASSAEPNKLKVYGNLPALFPPELLSVRLAWEGRGSDAVALFIATFVDCESELNHVFRNAASASGQRPAETNLPILDTPVPPSYLVSSLDQWGSKNGYGMSLGSDLPDEWLGYLARCHQREFLHIFSRALKELISDKKGKTTSMRNLLALKSKPDMAATPAPMVASPSAEVARSLVPVRMPKIALAAFPGRVSLTVEERVSAVEDVSPDLDSDDDEEEIPINSVEDAENSKRLGDSVSLSATLQAMDWYSVRQPELQALRNLAQEEAFLHMFRNHQDQLKDMFAKSDADSDASLSWVEMVKFLKVARMEWMTSNPALKVLFDAEGDDEEDAVGDVSWESLSQWVDALEIARKRPEVFAARNNDALDKLVDIRIASYDEKCRERERKTEETLKKSTKLGSSLWKSRLEAIFSSGVKKAGGIGDLCGELKRAAAASNAVKAVRWTSPTSFATDSTKAGTAAAAAVSEAIVRICKQLDQTASTRGSSAAPFEFLDPCFGPTIAPDDRNARVTEQYLQWLSEQGAAIPPGKPLTPDGVSCLYASGAPPGPAYPKPADLAWKRLMTDKGKPPKLWVDGATSSDPKQGQIGNCWLISALSLLATRDDLLFDVFDCGVDAAVQAKHSIYVLKLYKGLEWHYLILDDRFPVMVANNKPVFAHCEEDHEIWVPLIEKAFAKLHGTYDALISGYIDSALRDLTGLPTLTYQLAYSMVPPNLRRLWASEYGGARVYTKDEVAAAKAAGGKDPNTVFTRADDAASEDALWRRLSSLKEHGALIGCSHRCVGVAHDAEECDESMDGNDCEAATDEDGEAEDSGTRPATSDNVAPGVPEIPAKWRRTVNLRCMSAEEAKREGIRGPSGVEAPIKGYGIMQRHAYSLVDLKEVAGYRLVRVRNPWGVGEWTGAWSDKSKLVTQYRKELRKAFAAKAVVRKGRPVLDVEPFGANPNDGTFLMNFYDFCEFYTNIFAVVDVSTWKTQKYQCSWKDASGKAPRLLLSIGGDNVPAMAASIMSSHAGSPDVASSVCLQDTVELHRQRAGLSTLFIEIAQFDHRLTKGREADKFMSSMTVAVCPSDFEDGNAPEHIPSSVPSMPQIPARKRCSSSIEVNVPQGDFILLPQLLQGDPTGTCYLTVCCSDPICLRDAAASPIPLSATRGETAPAEAPVVDGPPDQEADLTKETIEDDSQYRLADVTDPARRKCGGILGSQLSKEVQQKADRIAAIRAIEDKWREQRDELFRARKLARQKDQLKSQWKEAVPIKKESTVNGAHPALPQSSLQVVVSHPPAAPPPSSGEDIIEPKYRSAVAQRDQAWKQLRDQRFKNRKAEEERQVARRNHIAAAEEQWKVSRDKAFKLRKERSRERQQVTFVPRKATMERSFAGAPDTVPASSKFAAQTTLGRVLRLGEVAFQPDVVHTVEDTTTPSGAGLLGVQGPLKLQVVRCTGLTPASGVRSDTSGCSVQVSLTLMPRRACVVNLNWARGSVKGSSIECAWPPSSQVFMMYPGAPAGERPALLATASCKWNKDSTPEIIGESEVPLASFLAPPYSVNRSITFALKSVTGAPCGVIEGCVQFDPLPDSLEPSAGPGAGTRKVPGPTLGTGQWGEEKSVADGLNFDVAPVASPAKPSRPIVLDSALPVVDMVSDEAVSEDYRSFYCKPHQVVLETKTSPGQLGFPDSRGTNGTVEVFKRANPFELRFVVRSERPVVSVSRKVVANDLMGVLERLRGRRSRDSSPSSFVPDDLVLQQQAEKAMSQWAVSKASKPPRDELLVLWLLQRFVVRVDYTSTPPVATIDWTEDFNSHLSTHAAASSHMSTLRSLKGNTRDSDASGSLRQQSPGGGSTLVPTQLGPPYPVTPGVQGLHESIPRSMPNLTGESKPSPAPSDAAHSETAFQSLRPNPTRLLPPPPGRRRIPEPVAWDTQGRRYLPEALSPPAAGSPRDSLATGPSQQRKDAVIMSLLKKLRSLSRSRTTATIEQMFKRFDKDNSRHLDKYELLQALKALSVDIDEADIDVVMDVFDSNKDGTINYGEFLFMFVDRQAILRRWEHKAGSAAAPTGMSMQGSGVFSKELECARLRSAMLSADSSGPKGNGQVTRKAAEATLLRSGLFDNKDFPLSAILDHFEAAVKVVTGFAGLVPVDDVIAYVSDPRPEIDSLKFGESVFPIAKRGASAPSTPGRSPGRPVFRVKVPKEFARLSKK